MSDISGPGWRLVVADDEPFGWSVGPTKSRSKSMSSIPSAVQQALNVQQQATQQKIDVALMKKSLDVQEQTGQAINDLLQQAVTVQRQLSEGRLDVRV